MVVVTEANIWLWGEININTIWSTYLQKIGTLYKTRTLRFSDRFKPLYTTAFAIDNKAKILEIGCGPGALSQALHRWYPNAEVVGSDRDTCFIEFARTNANDIKFCEADILELPFDDNSFDVTISHTVQEHVETERFFTEQYRVLKENGVCLVLSPRKGINIQSDTITELSSFEKEMYEKAEKYYRMADDKYGCCKFPLSEKELPLNMERYGFIDVTTNYLSINLTPDSNDIDEKTAIDIIEANRQVNVDSVLYLADIAPNVLTDAETRRWLTNINKRYDRRIEQYKNGEKQWDTTVSVLMVVRGVKICDDTNIWEG